MENKKTDKLIVSEIKKENSTKEIIEEKPSVKKEKIEEKSKTKKKNPKQKFFRKDFLFHINKR